MSEDVVKKCGYSGCQASLRGGKLCIACKAGVRCPKCARCRKCSGDAERDRAAQE